MTEPYLILHKVRGEPAFDIAIQTMIGDEEGWIIPTSGHRAYPWKNWKLEELTNPLKQEWPPIDSLEEGCPEDWPDHYACNHSPKPTGGMGQKLIEMLGLTKREPRRA